MAKIAVVFLLVAIVAICNGARVTREEPAKPDVNEFVKPFVDNLQKFFSQENLEKLKTETDAIMAKAKDTGEEALNAAIEYGKKLQEDLKKQKAAA